MELTNLVVNQTARNIMQQFSDDIEKAHQEGDIHPNGKWVWTKLANGKYDWRVKKNSGASAEGGSNKNEKKEEKQPASQKDERFSEDGIVGKDGEFNKQGKTYKRWSALREKVESGKATPEEKKEFAHLHNQYMNEKDRYAYEQSKQTDPKAKEPKYKTVDERREEYKGKKEEGKEQKENAKEIHEEELNQKLEKMSNDKKVGAIDFAFAGIGYYLVDHDPEIKELFDLGYSENSKKVQSLIDEKIIKESEEHQDEIKYALEKYGHDAVLKFITDNNDSTVSKRLAEKIIAHAIKPEPAPSAAAPAKTAKQVYDEDFNDDLKYYLDHKLPFIKEARGIKVGTVNDKGEIWVPSDNKTEDGEWDGRWLSKNEIEDRVNRIRNWVGDYKLTSEQKKAWPIGTKYTDEKGREFTITKHDSSRGRIKLSHVTDDGKKRVMFLTGHGLRSGLHPNITTGFPEIDKRLREVYDKAHAPKKNGI
jgi:hypothetical protein